MVILKRRPRFGNESSAGIIWAHGRRNFGLRDDGVLAVVLPAATLACPPQAGGTPSSAAAATLACPPQAGGTPSSAGGTPSSADKRR